MMARMGTVGRATRITLVLAVATVALSACSWRLETPSPSPLTPGAYERDRDAAAIAEARLVASLGDARPAGPGGAWLASYEAQAAPAHLEALGGVYVAHPRVAAPTPSATAGPAVGPSEFVRLAAFARDAELEGALSCDDPDLALLLASIGLADAAAIARQAERDAAFAGADVTVSRDRIPPLPDGVAPASLSPDATSLPEQTLENLISAHDYAAYVYEVIAARATGDMRGVAYSRGILHASRAKALVALAETDPRGPSYVVDRARLSDNDTMAALAASIEADIADLYIQAFGDVVKAGAPADTLSERAWLLSSAYDALADSLSWGDPAPDSVTAFPGVSVGTDTP